MWGQNQAYPASGKEHWRTSDGGDSATPEGGQKKVKGVTEIVSETGKELSPHSGEVFQEANRGTWIQL